MHAEVQATASQKKEKNKCLTKQQSTIAINNHNTMKLQNNITHEMNSDDEGPNSDNEGNFCAHHHLHSNSKGNYHYYLLSIIYNINFIYLFLFVSSTFKITRLEQ